MELNKETAMQLWNKRFGNETKVFDFAGRVIQKGAYNDKNSEYQWDIFLIMPLSKGGQLEEQNMVIAHVLTGKEKGEKFPAFKAHGISFRVAKIENLYEIQRVDNKVIKSGPAEQCINFMDSFEALRFYESLKGKQAKPRFVGSVFIRLLNIGNTALIDFIENLFDQESIIYDKKNFAEMRLIIRNYDMPLKSDIRVLLDKCILLNTYLKSYFREKELIEAYDIIYRVDYYSLRDNMYSKSRYINFEGIDGDFDDALFINKLVYENTDAIENEPDLEFNNASDSYQDYDYTFSKLEECVKKQSN